MTRHLETDAPTERELLMLPHDADALVAAYVGPVDTAPPKGYLARRSL